MKRSALIPLLVFACASCLRADAIYFDLSTGALMQDWTDASLISSNDDWSSVPSIIGYRGDGLASAGTSPATITAPGIGTPIDVLANQTNTSSSTGGIAEFDQLADPTIAFQGSGTADAPFLLFHLNSLFVDEVQVSYRLRDLDGSGDNALQSVALQYRIGETGDFINFGDAFVSDATAGPSLAGLVTPVAVTLPSIAAGVAQLQLRILTVDATGSDEWVGVDDIVIKGLTKQPVASVPDDLSHAWMAASLFGVCVAARRRGRSGRAPNVQAAR